MGFVTESITHGGDFAQHLSSDLRDTEGGSMLSLKENE